MGRVVNGLMLAGGIGVSTLAGVASVEAFDSDRYFPNVDKQEELIGECADELSIFPETGPLPDPCATSVTLQDGDVFKLQIDPETGKPRIEDNMHVYEKPEKSMFSSIATEAIVPNNEQNRQKRNLDVIVGLGTAGLTMFSLSSIKYRMRTGKQSTKKPSLVDEPL